MNKTKPIMLPTWVKETGEALYSPSMGISKEKWLQKYAHEAYMHSFTPGHLLKNPKKTSKKQGKPERSSKKQGKPGRSSKNPYTAKVRQDVWSLIPSLVETLYESANRGNVPRSEIPLFYQRLKSAISNLVHMYLEIHLALDPSASFDFGKDETEESKKQIAINRYYRDVVAIISIMLTEKLFMMDGNSLIAKLKLLGLDGSKPLNLLLSKSNRTTFINGIKKEASDILQNVDLNKVLDAAIERRKKG